MTKDATPQPGLLITGVHPKSLAAKSGILPGSRILTINGKPVEDELEYLFQSADVRLKFKLLPPDSAKPVTLLLQREGYDPIGIEVEELKTFRCPNHCVFCFVEQNPEGLRDSLYVKDDDFRLSFTHGQYITASGLTDADIDRIVKQRLSPLYISVHVTDHKMRCKMLGIAPSKTPDILNILRLFKKKRIEFHAQIVLCPGWNDGALLDKTLDDLTALFPALQSVAIVPVGLTAHREGLAKLQSVTPAIAEAIIRQVESRQKESRKFSSEGHRTILLADEFYLIAGMHPPKYNAWERDCQIENGVGMVESFWMGWTAALRKARANFGDRQPSIPPEGASPRISPPRKNALLLTGLSALPLMDELIEKTGDATPYDLRVVGITNALFGKSVTVSGLLPGRDFDRTLTELEKTYPRFELTLIPSNTLRPHDNRFLDGLTLDELRQRHPQTRIEVIYGGATQILKKLLENKK